MAANLAKWLSNRGLISKIRPSDGCKGNTVPSTVVQRYDLRKPGGHLGNVGFTCGARCRRISPTVEKPLFTFGTLSNARAESVDLIAALAASIFAVLVLLAAAAPAQADPAFWRFEWPSTDFSKFSVDLNDIISGGPGKDGIPAIDDPVFGTIADAGDLADTEPVITVVVNGDARAYPLNVLMWHEIVNDEVGGVPVSVTYCPLCNSAVAFDRRVGDRVLDFGTTGKLRFSDLVMYDRQTESWWQQFIGEAIVGEMLGTRLEMIPVRVESFARFRERHPDGMVQKSAGGFFRSYGRNPYAGYDSARWPFLYRGNAPEGLAPLAYVLAVGDKAWSLDYLRENGRTEDGELIITWEPGQNSALDAAKISEGRDIGNVVVQRREKGALVDVVHDLTFAFTFHAFNPDVEIVTR